MSGRLERRIGSVATLADSLAAFSQTLGGAPFFSNVIVSTSDGVVSANQLFVADTNANSDIDVRLSPLMRQGDWCWVANAGTGVVRVRVPDGQTYVDSATVHNMTTDYDLKVIIKISQNTFIHLL